MCCAMAGPTSPKSMTAEERDKERSLNASMTVVSSQIRREISLPQPDQTKLANLEDRLQQARLEYEAYETRIHAAHPELKFNAAIPSL